MKLRHTLFGLLLGTPSPPAHGHVRRVELDGAETYARERACWAKCRGREAYHEVPGVVSGCTEAAAAFCDEGTRGGLEDAAWDACQP